MRPSATAFWLGLSPEPRVMMLRWAVAFGDCPETSVSSSSVSVKRSFSQEVNVNTAETAKAQKLM
jgi:hypothetical protein